MALKVEFFENKFVKAIGAGIYGIYIKNNNTEELLYIGESVFVLVRCAIHLYKIVEENGYLGFTKDMLDNNDIELIFKLLDLEPDISKRKKKEKEFVKEKKPRLQSGISDRVKPIEEMIGEITKLLDDKVSC